MGQLMTGKKIGYVRVSTKLQNIERQLDGMELDLIFTDHASGKDTKRPKLTELLNYIRDGDVVYAHSMDRLARNLDDLRRIIKTITDKQAQVDFVKEIDNLIAQSQNKSSEPLNSKFSWANAYSFLSQKAEDGSALVDKYCALQLVHDERVVQLSQEIETLKNTLAEVEKELSLEIKNQRSNFEKYVANEKNLEDIADLLEKTEEFYEREVKMNSVVKQIISSKLIEDMTEEEISSVLWSIGLEKESEIFKQNQITGEILATGDFYVFEALGISHRNICCFLYRRNLLAETGLLEESPKCIVCTANTVESTIELLKKYKITLPDDKLRQGDWIAPYLLFMPKFTDEFCLSAKNSFAVRKGLERLSAIHQNHLKKIPKPTHLLVKIKKERL